MSHSDSGMGTVASVFSAARRVQLTEGGAVPQLNEEVEQEHRSWSRWISLGIGFSMCRASTQLNHTSTSPGGLQVLTKSHGGCCFSMSL